MDIESTVRELDALYAQSLDRLEAHAADAEAMDRRIRQILDRPDSDASILDFTPQLSISPRLAFRSLAMQLVKVAVDQGLTPREVSALDYDDLLSWETEPARTLGMSIADEVAMKVAYARTRSLRSFWEHYTVRVSPNRDPKLSANVSVRDLVQSVAIDLPEAIVVPYFERDTYRSLTMKIPKSIGELEWVLHPPAISGLSRTLHAFVTLCRARGQASAAELMQDLAHIIQTTLKQNHYRYQPRSMFYAGDVLRIQMNRDHIEFCFYPDVFALIKQEMTALTDIIFVKAPRTS
jgi:hypothetical protein